MVVRSDDTLPQEKHRTGIIIALEFGLRRMVMPRPLEDWLFEEEDKGQVLFKNTYYEYGTMIIPYIFCSRHLIGYMHPDTANTGIEVCAKIGSRVSCRVVEVC